MEWQPIETAPRDGTEVLITHCETSVMAVACVNFGKWRDCGQEGWGGGFVETEPTHWMPLPEAPKA